MDFPNKILMIQMLNSKERAKNSMKTMLMISFNCKNPKIGRWSLVTQLNLSSLISMLIGVDHAKS